MELTVNVLARRGWHWIWLGLALLALVAAGACEAKGGGQPLPGRGAQTIENKGSDTMVNLALAWAEAYSKIKPDVLISVTGGGSGTGIAALINGTVDITNASRAVSSDEIAAVKSGGFDPIQTAVALDAIAVVVHPSNPVNELTFAQLADIFTGRVTNWREAGGENRPIVLVSRESNSGTYVYFLEHVVRLGRKDNTDLFSPNALLMPSSEGIGNEVRQNPNAIGYDGLGYVTPEEKTIRVGAKAGAPFVAPTADAVTDGTYPIARPLFMITRGQPSGAAADYLAWIMGPQGQAIVRKLGFVPLN